MVATISAAPSLPALVGFSLLTALVTAVVPFLAYTLGLRSVEASKAGILAAVVILNISTKKTEQF